MGSPVNNEFWQEKSSHSCCCLGGRVEVIEKQLSALESEQKYIKAIASKASVVGGDNDRWMRQLAVSTEGFIKDLQEDVKKVTDTVASHHDRIRTAENQVFKLKNSIDDLAVSTNDRAQRLENDFLAQGSNTREFMGDLGHRLELVVAIQNIKAAELKTIQDRLSALEVSKCQAPASDAASDVSERARVLMADMSGVFVEQSQALLFNKIYTFLKSLVDKQPNI